MNLRRVLTARSLISVCYVVVALVVSLTAAQAQTGKIRAKVVDAKSGELLVRATVQVVESKQGAYTKDDGFATIINVAPGESFHVMAKYAGYKAQTIASVKILSDETTTLTFRLTNSDVDTIIVRTDKIMVSKTTTEVGRKFLPQDVAKTPGRQNLNEIIRLTPGVYTDASSGGLSFNGSRGTSNSIRINGVETVDPVTGKTSALQSSLSKFAISEINVVSAGADASKGGFTGGSVNSTTKAGGEAFEFQFNYRQDIPAFFGYSSNGLRQLGQNDRIYEVALGGPLTDELHYYITAKGETRQFDNYFTIPRYINEGLDVRDPVGNTAGQLPNREHYNRSVTGKLTFGLLGFNLTADADIASESRQYNDVYYAYADPANLTASNETNNLYSLSGSKQIGEGILQFDASYLTKNYDEGRYDLSHNSNLFSLYNIYKPTDKFTYDDNNHVLRQGADGIIDIYTPVTRQIPDPVNPAQVKSLTAAGINPLTGHIEGPLITQTTQNPYGLFNEFATAGNASGFAFDQRQQIQVDGNFTQQIGAHLFNAGVEGHFWHVASQTNQLPWDANPFKDSFDVKPNYGAVFVEDKMEFSDITFSPGVRFDFYNPGSNRNITNLFNPVNTSFTRDPVTGKIDTVTSFAVGNAPVQAQLSPRLGITYAVTEQTTFNFNYGWYFKEPLLDNVLANTGGNLQQVFSRGNQIIGNGALKAERTKEITVGFNTQLNDVFAVSLQGIYKDLRNHTGLEIITGPLLPIGYSIYSDDQYGNVRSLQLTLDKRMSNNFSARLNYTYSVAKGTSASATSNYQQILNFDPNSLNTALPLQPFYLDYDKTHVAQFIFNLNFAKGDGPTVFGTKLLQLFSLSTTTEYQTGTPYTRLDQRGTQIGEYNAERQPDYFETAAQLTRTIPFGDLFGENMKNFFLDLTLEVTNVFNRTQPLRVYAQTGQGDDDGSNNRWLGTVEYYNNPTTTIINTIGAQYDPLGKLLYNPRADLNHDGKVSLAEQQVEFTQLRHDQFARRTNYQAPRRFFFNVALRF
jgi:outer membrane receptor protein involved in Fe transport